MLSRGGGGAINVLSPNIQKSIFFYNEENFVGGVDFLDDTQITVIGLSIECIDSHYVRSVPI